MTLRSPLPIPPPPEGQRRLDTSDFARFAAASQRMPTSRTVVIRPEPLRGAAFRQWGQLHSATELVDESFVFVQGAFAYGMNRKRTAVVRVPVDESAHSPGAHRFQPAGEPHPPLVAPDFALIMREALTRSVLLTRMVVVLELLAVGLRLDPTGENLALAFTYEETPIVGAQYLYCSLYSAAGPMTVPYEIARVDDQGRLAGAFLRLSIARFAFQQFDPDEHFAMSAPPAPFLPWAVYDARGRAYLLRTRPQFATRGPRRPPQVGGDVSGW